MSLRDGLALMSLGQEPLEIRECSSVVLIDTGCKDDVKFDFISGDVKQIIWRVESV
jgi:hypothetical protein